MNTIHIQEFDDIRVSLRIQGKSVRDVDEEQVNYAIFKAYLNSKRDGRALLNFDETLWYDDVQPIVATCRKLGINEFTITTNQTGLIEILGEFQRTVVRISCVIKIATHRIFSDGHERDWEDEALLMRIEGEAEHESRR